MRGKITLEGELIRGNRVFPFSLTSVLDPPGRWRGFIHGLRHRFFPHQLNHDQSVRNQIADLVTALVDAGSANASGQMQIYTESFVTLLAEVDFGFPAFDAAQNGVCTALDMPRQDDDANDDGLAGAFRVVDRDRNLVWSGEIDIGGEELDMAAGLEVNQGDIFKITGFSYAAPP